MKKIFKTLGIQLSLFLFLISSFGIIYAAWNDTVNSGDPITAASWNEVVDRVKLFNVDEGNIGIGIINPTEKISISGDIPLGFYDEDNNLHSSMRVGSSDTNRLLTFNFSGQTGDQGINDNWAVFRFNGGYNKIFLGSDSSRAIIQSPRDLHLSAGTSGGGDANSAGNLVLLDSGNIGIGTSTPGSKLSIVGLPSGTSGLNAGLDGSSVGAVCIMSDGDMYIDSDGVCN